MNIDVLEPPAYQAELCALRQRVADLELALAAGENLEHGRYAREAQLEQFFARAADGFFIMQLDHPLRWDATIDKEQALDYTFTHQHLTKVNDAMLAQYGATREQFIGLTPADFFAHDPAYGRRVWRDLFDTGRLHLDTDERKFNGTPMWIEGDYICLYDAQGRITGHFGVQREITARRQSEQTLRTHEHNLWSFFNTIDQLLFVLDNQGRILHANQTVYQRLGYTAEELVGQSVLLVHPPDRREEAGRIVADMLAGRCDYCPVPVQTKDGRLIPVETRVQTGEWSGHPAIFGVTKDLSALKSSEEKFTKVFEASPTLMAISDLDTGHYIDVNAAFLTALGFAREEIIGRTAQDLDLFANPDQRAAALQYLSAHGHLRDFDVDVRAKCGEIRHGLFAAEYVQLQDRRVLLTVMNDMTERRQSSEALARRATQLSILNEIGQDVTAALAVAEVLQRAAQLIHDRLGYQHIGIFLLDPARGELVMRARAGDFVQFFAPDHHLPLDRGLVGWVARHGRHLLVNDVSRDPRYCNEYGSAMPTCSELSVPIMVGGAVHGVLDVQSAHLNAFDEDDILPQETLAGQIAVALENARLYEAAQREIAERKQAETALRESELKFRRVVEESSDAFVLIDETGRVIEWNRAAEVLTGLSAAQLLGQPYWEVSLRVSPVPWPPPPHMIERIKGLILAALRTGTGDFIDVPVEQVVRRPNGELCNVLQYIYPIKTDTGYWLGSSSRDITERKQMEQALRTSEEKFRRVVEESRDALSLCDEDGTIIEWNHSTEVLTGISRAEALGQPYWEIQWRLLSSERRSPAVFEQLQQQFQGALRTGHASFMDKPIVAHFQRADSEPRIALQHVYPIKTARGFWLGNTSLDITDLKRTEAALSQLNAELEQRVADRTRELIEANLRLTELDRLKDEFISRINHELRTPLTSIKAYIELLSFGKPEKILKYVQIIGEQSDRLQQIIESLLEIPQLRVGDIDVNPELVEINALVSGLCANRQSVAVLRGVQLRTDLSPQLPLVLTDKSLVLRSLLNVVTNALNYTPRSGTVTLSTASHAEADRVWVTIAIADTGPGISAKDRPYIFEPFYRGDATNDYKTPGTGVGLFMARRLLDTLGGKISVDSQPGEGATFTLWLPDGAVVHA